MRSTPVRRLRLMGICFLGALALATVTNRVADPYGIWRAQAIDDAYRRLHDDRLSRPYRLLRERPVTVLLGNSRVAWGMPVAGAASDGVFNAALPGARLDDIEALADAATQQPQVKRLVWAIDLALVESSLKASPPEEVEALRDRLQGSRSLMITEALLSEAALADSWRVMQRLADSFLGRADLALPRTVAWSPERLRADLTSLVHGGAPTRDESALGRELVEWGSWYRRYRFDEGSWMRALTLAATARSRGVEVVIVLLPMREYELEAIRQTGRWELYQQWKRRLLEVGPYWDFSGYGAVARMDELYPDLVHIHPAMGHVILRRLLDEDCRACGETAQRILATGVWVDEPSIDAHLRRQDAMRVAREQEPSRYAEVVARYLDDDPSRRTSEAQFAGP